MVKSVKELSFTQKEKHHNQISPLSPYYQYAAEFNIILTLSRHSLFIVCLEIRLL